jgi:tetratricopeptide (TPR) repeat protein
LKESASRDARLSSFVRAERATVVYEEFRDVKDLKQRIGDVLRQSHTSAIRRGVLRRRRVLNVEASHTTHLLEVGLESAERELWEGSAVVAAEILAELENLFGETEELREQLDLVSGRVHGTLGDARRAADAYHRILERPGSSLVGRAVAVQNLAIEAFHARDLARARELTRDALRRHVDCKNWFGVLQTLVNAGVVAATQGRLLDARRLSGLAERVLRGSDCQLPEQELSLLALEAMIAVRHGRHSVALELYRRGWSRSLRLGHLETSCDFAQNIGSSNADLGRLPLAVRWYRRALGIAVQGANARREEELERCLGLVRYRQGQHVAAVDHFERARALAAKIGDQWRTATLTADIGALLVAARKPSADDELRRALRLLTDLQDKSWLFRVQCNRGILARRDSRRTEAESIFRDALQYAGSAAERRLARENIASVYLDPPVDAASATQSLVAAAHEEDGVGVGGRSWLLGQYGAYLRGAGCVAEAMALYDEGISVALSVEDRRVLADLRNDRGVALGEQGLHGDALEAFREDAEWARAEQERALELRALHNMGETQRRIGDLSGSTESLGRALRLALELRDRESWRAALALLAMTQLAGGLLEESEDTARRARRAASRVGDRVTEASAIGTLAGIAYARGQYAIAAVNYTAAARLDQGSPIHHCEDLMGLLESHAAAGRRRPMLRAAQKVINYAQEHALQRIAWGSLLRAADWEIRGGRARSCTDLVVAALVLAHQSARPEVSRALAASSAEETAASAKGEDGFFFEVLLTLAFYLREAEAAAALALWDSMAAKMSGVDEEARERFRQLARIAQDAVVAGASEADRAMAGVPGRRGKDRWF